jgi:endoribonuclease Dicer
MALTLETPAAPGRPSRPLILLSREALPDLQTFPLFFGKGEASLIKLIHIPGVLVFDGSDTFRRDGIVAFTLRLFNDVFSKSFDTNAEEMPYFLAPSSVQHQSYAAEPPNLFDAIDWPAVDLAASTDCLSLSSQDPKTFYRDRFVTDPFDGGRKYFSKSVRQDLKPLDPVPDGTPPPRHQGWKKVKHNIQEYSISIWGAARAKRTWQQDQPVVEMDIAPLRRNMLDEWDADDETRTTCFVIMEPLTVSPV